MQTISSAGQALHHKNTKEHNKRIRKRNRRKSSQQTAESHAQGLPLYEHEERQSYSIPTSNRFAPLLTEGDHRQDMSQENNPWVKRTSIGTDATPDTKEIASNITSIVEVG